MTRRRFWPLAPATPSRLHGAAALALLAGLVALAVPTKPFGEHPTWETLLAPYSTGAPLPNATTTSPPA